jgi:hypothetical protein
VPAGEELTMARQPGLDDRYRDNDGQTRENNGNTRIDTLRQTYGDDFAAGMRGDAHLRTLLDRTHGQQFAVRLLAPKRQKVACG